MVNATEHVVGDVTLGRETEKHTRLLVGLSWRVSDRLCYTTHLFNQSDPSLTQAKVLKRTLVLYFIRLPSYSSQLRTCSTSSALENICLTCGQEQRLQGLRTHTDNRSPVLSCMEIKTIFAKNSFNPVCRVNKREVYVVVPTERPMHRLSSHLACSTWVTESLSRKPQYEWQRGNWTDRLLHRCSGVWSSVPLIFPTLFSRGPEMKKKKKKSIVNRGEWWNTQYSLSVKLVSPCKGL